MQGIATWISLACQILFEERPCEDSVYSHLLRDIASGLQLY